MRNRKAYGRPIPVALTEQTLARLDAIADRVGEKRSTIMRIAMTIGLDALEKAVEQPADLTALIAPGKSSSSASTYPPHRDQSFLVEDKPVKKTKAA